MNRALLGVIFCGFCGLGAPHTASALAQTVQVGRWDRFEATVPNSRRYADPYADVTLKVTYTCPDGRRVAFWGFYDGGTTWKIRFMPDQLGTWQYEAVFSDGAPGIRGSFACVPSDLPGMISQDAANPQWFGFRGGRHLLVRSFHVGDRFFAANWSSPKRAAFLDWAQGQGYNMLSIASFFLNRDQEGRGRGWKTPALWPLDAAEYRKMEAILDDLARRRLLVYPFAGFFGRAARCPTEPADQSRYLRYMLARVGPYWNLLWNVAGPEPLLRGKTYLTAEQIHRLGEEIRRLDPFGHLLSVHNPTGDDPFRDASWASYGTLQGPKTKDLATLSQGLLRNHHPSRPLYAQETLWPGNENHPAYTAEEIRKNAYVILMSAATLNYADMDGNSSTGFSGTMDLADPAPRTSGGAGTLVQVRHDIVRKVWDFFETVPFYRMNPRPDLCDRGFLLAEEGKRYLGYLPSGGAMNIRVSGGSFTVKWINARNPMGDQRSSGTTRDGRDLTAPDENDWLVHLERRAPTGERRR
jgi:hypothetical protein